MTRLAFLYGTLLHEPLLAVVGGGGARPVGRGRLAGWRIVSAPDGTHPVPVPDEGAELEGGLFSLGAAARERIDFYEVCFGCRPVEVTVRPELAPATGAGGAGAPAEGVAAVAWMPEEPALPPSAEAPFVLADWVARWGAISVLAAEELMALHGEMEPERARRLLPAVRARAQSRLTAETEVVPPRLRARFDRREVNVCSRHSRHVGPFLIEEVVLDHPRFDGRRTDRLTRTAFVAMDAVTVLPWDPVRDRVLVLEQFRVGPWARGAPFPWMLEPIAGRRDPGESWEEAARREAREEAGISLGRLIPIGGYYPTPGMVAEYLRSYVALAELPDEVAGIHGAEDEGEDIRAHVLAFEHFMEVVESGEVEAGPLLLSAWWLKANRHRWVAGADG